MKVICPTVTVDSRNSNLSIEAFLMEDGKAYNFTRWNGEGWYRWWEDGNPANCGNYAQPMYEEDDGDYMLIEIDLWI